MRTTLQQMTPVQRIAALGLILYLSRAGAELGAMWQWPLGAVIGGVLGLAAGVLIVWRSKSLPQAALILWGYVLNPYHEPRLALWIGLAAGLAWIMERREIDVRFVDAAVFLAALAIYWITLSPGVLPADAGEFQLVAAKLGVAHPPGYPLYTMLAWLSTLITPGNPAYGVNLFSAVAAALAVMLAGRAAHHLSGNIWAGVAASVVLAIAPSFWNTATQASIRPLTAMFTALCVERLARYKQQHFFGGMRAVLLRKASYESKWVLAGFALAFGLGLAHHPTLAFLGSLFGIYLLLTDPSLIREPRRWVLPLIAFAAGFLPWLYLPIRGARGAVLAPGDLATWPGFWNHVLAKGFAGDFFSFHTSTDLADRGLVWLNIMRIEWTPFILIAGVLAAVILAWRDWRTLILLGGGFAVNTFIAMTYRAPQTVEYLIPSYVLFAIGLGVGLGNINDPQITQISQMEKTAIRLGNLWAIPITIVLVAGVIQAVDQWGSFAWLARDNSTRERAEALLDEAPQNAVILASWHWATPMMALQATEGFRPDVEVFYVYPDGAERLEATWVRRIEENIAHRAVVITSYYPVEFAATPYFYEPVDGGWIVRTVPRRDLPEEMESPRGTYGFSNGISLVGIESKLLTMQVNGTLSVRLAWRIDAPQTRDVTASVHFVNSAGTVISSSDRTLPASRAQVGDMLIDDYTIGMPPTGSPSPLDSYRLEAGLYNVEADGQINQYVWAATNLMASVGDVTVLPAKWPTPIDDPPNVSLGGEMVLSGVKVTPSGLLKPGQEVIIDLTFLGARPLLADYVVKVDLIGDGYVWKVPSDHIPADGGIPTLKWLYGWEVHDRHRFIVPADASTTKAHAELVVYDHFTNQVLPILDVALSQQGTALRIWEWNGE